MDEQDGSVRGRKQETVDSRGSGFFGTFWAWKKHTRTDGFFGRKKKVAYRKVFYVFVNDLSSWSQKTAKKEKKKYEIMK